MKPEELVSPPLPPVVTTLLAGARTLIRNGLMQNNLDANFHQIENLDISNIHFPGPPTQTAPPHKWFNSYNANTYLFGSTQPGFVDLSGNLTHLQKIAIDEVGTLLAGVWQGTIILGAKLDTLDRIRAPLDNVNLGLKRIVNLQDPLDPQDACTLHVAHMLSGRNPKQAVRGCATVHITPFGIPSRTLVDNIDLIDGDRVLLANQGAARAWENGIWIVHDSAHGNVWTRPADFDNSPPTVPVGLEIDDAQVFVLEGDTHAGTTWFQDQDAPIYITEQPPPRPGEPPIPYPHFVLINTSLDINAGPGLHMSGRTISAVGTAGRIAIGVGIDIDPTYIGQSTIRTLGIVTAGTWRGTVVEGQYGGTGVANVGRHIHLTLGDFFIGTSADPTYPDEPDAIPGSNLTLRIRGVTNVIVPQLGVLATIDQEETFTNKRIQKRVSSFLAASTPNINTDDCDVFKLTAQDKAIVSMTTGLSGTPFDGQELQIFIEEIHEIPPPPAPPDIPVVQSFPIVWGDAWRDSPNLQLPEVTVGLAGIFLWFVFNTEHGKWVLVQKVEDIAL